MVARRQRAANEYRTTLVLDASELQEAQRVLGTRTTRETVNRALREVNRQAALRRATALVQQGHLPLVQPDDLTHLRRSRGI